MSNKIAEAVLELRADGSAFTNGLGKAKTELKAFGGEVTGLGKTFEMVGKGMAAVAVGAAVKQFIDYAGDIVDLSSRLKITTDVAQEWESVFGAAGVSLETVAKASDTLTTKLISGDKSAVGALKAMGLNVEKLIAMKPADRFNTVADAVANIQHEGEQLYASRTLFGKGGADLLSALDGHLSESIQRMRELGLVIDEETLRSADDFGDQLGFLGKQLLAIVATVVGPLLPALSALGNVLSWIGANVVKPVLNVAIKGAMTMLAGFTEVVLDVVSRLLSLGSHIPGVGGKFAAMSEQVRALSQRSGQYMADLWKQTDATDKAGDSAAKATPKMLGLGGATESASKDAKKAAEEYKRWRETVDEVLLAAKGYEVVLDTIDGTVVEAIKYYREQGVEMGRLVTMYALSRVQSEAMTEAERVEAEQLRELAGEAANAARAFKDFQGSRRGDSLEILDEPRTLQKLDGLLVKASNKVKKANLFGSALADGIAELPDIIRQALTGGGGMSGAFQAFGSMVGSKIGGGLFEAGGPLNGLRNKLAGIFGTSFGMALPGIGAALGALVGPALAKLWGALKRAFGGPSEEELKGRDVEAKFEQEFKNFDDMVNRIGDAYAATGKTREQAAADVKAMLDAEKEGPAAVQAWIDKFREALEQADRLREADASAAAETERQVEAAKTQIMQHAEDELRGMIDTRNELAKGVAAEAAEENMGVVEAAQRKELEGLDAQIQEKADAYAELAKVTGQAMAEEIVNALRDLKISPVTVPVNVEMPENPYRNDWNPGWTPDGGYVENGPPVIPMPHGGFGRALRPTLFYTGGNEDFAFSGEGKSFNRSGGDSADVALQVAAALASRPIEVTTYTVMDGAIAAKAIHRVYENNADSARTRARAVLGIG